MGLSPILVLSFRTSRSWLLYPLAFEEEGTCLRDLGAPGFQVKLSAEKTTDREKKSPMRSKPPQDPAKQEKFSVCRRTWANYQYTTAN